MGLRTAPLLDREGSGSAIVIVALFAGVLLASSAGETGAVTPSERTLSWRPRDEGRGLGRATLRGTTDYDESAAGRASTRCMVSLVLSSLAWNALVPRFVRSSSP